MTDPRLGCKEGLVYQRFPNDIRIHNQLGYLGTFWDIRIHNQLDMISRFVCEHGGLSSKWPSINNQYLVGGIPTPLKNMSSSVGMIIPNIWKNKTCSKPPTSIKYIKETC